MQAVRSPLLAAAVGVLLAAGLAAPAAADGWDDVVSAYKSQLAHRDTVVDVGSDSYVTQDSRGRRTTRYDNNRKHARKGDILGQGVYQGCLGTCVKHTPANSPVCVVGICF